MFSAPSYCENCPSAVVRVGKKSLIAIDGITQPGVKVQAKGGGRYRAFKSFKTGNHFAPFKPLNPAGSNRSTRSMAG